jgi:hypothetical protein
MGTPKIFLHSAVFGVLLVFSIEAFGQYSANGICCDPTSIDYGGNPGSCLAAGETPESPTDGLVCDPNCTSDYDGEEACTTIPLDGGLSLLAIAGGGLATAAMRRRREEELLEKEA